MKTMLAFLCLLVTSPLGASGDNAAEDDRKLLQGEWLSHFSRAPGSADALIQRTLAIGSKSDPSAVRLSWSMYCGASRITGGVDFTGRLVGVENRDKKRVLVLAGEKDVRHEIEFQRMGDELWLQGTIHGVSMRDEWRLAPPSRK